MVKLNSSWSLLLHFGKHDQLEASGRLLLRVCDGRQVDRVGYIGNWQYEYNMGAFINGGTPKWRVYKWKIQFKWMIWGYFVGSTISGNFLFFETRHIFMEVQLVSIGNFKLLRHD